MKIKNTTKQTVLLSVEPGITLSPGDTMEVDGKLAEDALKIDGIKKDKEKKATKEKAKKTKK